MFEVVPDLRKCKTPIGLIRTRWQCSSLFGLVCPYAASQAYSVRSRSVPTAPWVSGHFFTMVRVVYHSRSHTAKCQLHHWLGGSFFSEIGFGARTRRRSGIGRIFVLSGEKKLYERSFMRHVIGDIMFLRICPKGRKTVPVIEFQIFFYLL